MGRKCLQRMRLVKIVAELLLKIHKRLSQVGGKEANCPVLKALNVG